MNVIIEEFSRHCDLPVDIADISQAILDKGFVAFVQLYDIDTDPHVLSGMLYFTEDRPPYSVEERRCAHVSVSINLPETMRRLICCKELLHILDSGGAAADTQAAVSSLVAEIILPNEIARDLALLKLPELSDRFGILTALAVLLPRDALADLRPLFDAGKIGIEEIAQMAELPESVVAFALTDDWVRVLDRICPAC